MFLDTSKARVDKGNHYMYVYDPKHPLANRAGKVYVHRHVATLKYGSIPPNLHVNHINGNRLDNSPENLELLTPREHVVKDMTRRGKSPRSLVASVCLCCGESYQKPDRGRYYCSVKCSREDLRSKIMPDAETLSRLVWEIPTRKLADRFKVSDVLIAKWCKSLGISKPPRGYWARVAAGKE